MKIKMSIKNKRNNFFFTFERHKRLFKISIPIIISNSTIPLVGIVDAAVIGQLEIPKLIASVGLGASAMATIYWLFGFLRMGTTGLVSQAIGKGLKIEIGAILIRGMIIGLVCGLLLLLFKDLIFLAIFYFFQAKIEIEQFSILYLSIRFWGCPFTIMTFAMVGWLIAKEKTILVLFILFIMNLTNIFLDYIFVNFLEFGVKGVAAASIISEMVAFLLCLFFCFSAFKIINKSNFKILLINWKNFLNINFNILLRSLLLQLVIIYHIFWGTNLNTNLLTVNQIFILFLNFAVYVLDGIAFSAEVLVGNAVGKKNSNEIKNSFIICFFWSAIFALVLSLFYLMFTINIIQVMTQNSEILELSKKYLILIALIPLTGFLSWTVDGVFLGATETKIMRNTMLISTLFYFFLVVFFRNYEFYGLWISINVFFIFRGLILTFYFPKIIKKYV